MGYIGSDPKTNESVSTAQLVDDSVTNAKIVDNVLFTSVTSSVVSASGTITADSFTGTFSGALSSSAQIATSISGSSTSLSSSLATRTTTLESASGSFASDLVTLKGSGTTQGVGTSNSPTFNNITATGTVTAQEFHSEFVSASILFTSGSHKFGDTSDDTHLVTGSMNISGSLTLNDGTLTVTDNVDFNGDLDVDGTTNLDNTDIDGTLTVDGGNIVFNEDSANQDFRVESNGQTHMLFVDGDDKIGIAESSPSTTLHITRPGSSYTAANLTEATTGAAFLRIVPDGTNPNSLFASSVNNYRVALQVSGSADNDLMLQPFSGKVGIGTDRFPYTDYALFHIKGRGSDDGNVTGMTFHVGGTNAASRNFSITTNNSAHGAMDFRVSEANNNTPNTNLIMQLKKDAVGIGTNSPSAKLHVAGGSGNDVEFHLGDADGDRAEFIYRNDADFEIRSTGATGNFELHNEGNRSIIFNTNGSERMRIVGGGYVGIGTDNPDRLLHVEGQGGGQAVAVFEDTAANANILIKATVADKNSILNFGDAGSTEIGQVDYDHADNSMRFVTNAGERMRITSGRKIAMFTSSIPQDFGDARGHLLISSEDNAGANNYAVLQLQGHSINNDGALGTIHFYDHSSSNASIQVNRDTSTTTADMMFSTKNGSSMVERIRIKSTGAVGIGTNNPATLGLHVKAEDGGQAVFLENSWNGSPDASSVLDVKSTNTNKANNLIRGYNGGSNVFAVEIDGDVNNTNNNYGALSDKRLKENIIDATPKLDELNQVRIVNYNFKDDPAKKQLGVVAQELQEIFPKMVSEYGEDGYLNVKYSIFVPMLIKAVQELSAKVEALEG